MTMTLKEWLMTGIEHGWCSPIHCLTHDNVLMTKAERTELDDGGEPCLYIIRIADDQEHHEQMKITLTWRDAIQFMDDYAE